METYFVICKKHNANCAICGKKKRTFIKKKNYTILIIFLMFNLK